MSVNYLDIDTIIKQHPCLVFPADIESLCRPLHHLGITYFGHAIIHENGSVTGVSNNAAYLDFYLRKKYYSLDLQNENDIGVADHVWGDFLPRYKGTEDFYQSALAFKVYHIFSLIKSAQTEIHIYHFATDRFKPGMNAFYIEHRDLLEKFILYYHDQLKKSTSLQKAHQLFLPIKTLDSTSSRISTISSMLDDKDINEFLQAISASTYTKVPTFLGNASELSFRENQCLRLWAHGATAKSIAITLGLSQRTVYFYLENIKKKIGIYRKSDLSAYYWNNISN